MLLYRRMKLRKTFAFAIGSFLGLVATFGYVFFKMPFETAVIELLIAIFIMLIGLQEKE